MPHVPVQPGAISPGGVGSAGVVPGLSSWGGKDGSTSLLFPVADGRLRGPASGGSGEKCLPVLPWHLGCTEPLALPALKPCFLFPQPGKLTEAFKYFVQGMGYSKWEHSFLVWSGVVVKGTQPFWSI